MKTKLLPLILAGLMFCIVACKKAGLSTANNASANKSVDVYVAGFVDGQNNKAAYWKNGVITKLTDSPSFAIARGVAVQGGDVYVAGTVTSFALSTNNAVYWKNGVANTLADISNNSQAWGIAFQGNDLYVVGGIFSNNSFHATFWKNGTANTLPGGIVANAIAVNGADVYIAGSAGDPNNSVAAYWKNGVATMLIGGFSANTIAINGNDVYVGGTTVSGAAVYWKNGAPTMLTNDAVANKIGYSVYSIATNGTDVFVAGGTDYNNGNTAIYDHGNGSVATLWKNTVPQMPSVPTNTPANPLNNIVTAICLHGNDVYMASQVINNSTQQFESYYWKNGVPVQLSNGGTNGAFANSITVVAQQQ